MQVVKVRNKAIITGTAEELERLAKMLTFVAMDMMKNEKIISVYEKVPGGLAIPRALVKAPVEEADWQRCEIPFHYKLYPYQEQAVKEAIEKGGNVIISAPMGTGKTVMALYLAHHYGLKTLVVVHTDALFRQWIEKIKEICGFTPSIIRGNICDTSKPITVAMLRTLAIGKRIDRKKILTEFGLTIYDEAHRMPTEKFHKVVGMFWDKHRIALTGTIKRRDGFHRLLFMHIGEIVKVKKKQISPKVIAYFFYDERCSSDGCIKNGEFFLPFYLNKISRIKERTILIACLAYFAYKRGRKVMVLSDRLNILDDIEKLLKEKECNIGWITGEKKKEGDIYLATFGSAGEGVDIPDLDLLILATPRTFIKQAIGRLLRPKSVVPIIIDIVDNSKIMKKFYYARRKIYEEMNMKIEEKIVTKQDVYKFKKEVWHGRRHGT